VNKDFNYSVLGREKEYCDEGVCLSVCLSEGETFGPCRPRGQKIVLSLGLKGSASFNVAEINFLQLQLQENRHRERKCADTIGRVPVPWAGHFQC